MQRNKEDMKLRFTVKHKKLYLAKIEEKDISQLFVLLKDKEVNRYLPWFPVKTMEEAKTFYQERYQNKEANPFYFGIFDEKDLCIGYININHYEGYEMGYALAKAYWNQGIVSAAAKRLLEYVKDCNIPYVTATHDRYNVASGEVMKHVGMKYCYSYDEVVQPKNEKVTFRMYQIHFDETSDFVYYGYSEQRFQE